MIPLFSIVKKDKIVHVYRFSELREFVKRGKEYGDCGWIVISRTFDKMVTYKGFGTIEHPLKEMITIVIKEHREFDGTSSMPYATRKLQDYSYQILDLKNNKNIELKPIIE